MSNVDCGVENPEVPGMLCGKAPHPYGAHMDAVTSTVWEGLIPPPKRAKGSRVKEVIDVIGGAGHNVATGPPVLPERPIPPMGQEEGMAASYEAATAEFKAEASATIERIARRQESLTTDDVWSDLRARGFDTEHRACMGTLIRNAASRGLIEKTDRMVSTEREDQRAHGLIVWRSLVH